MVDVKPVTDLPDVENYRMLHHAFCAAVESARRLLNQDYEHERNTEREERVNNSESDLVNVAVRRSLAEDAEDLQAFETRKKEPSLLFENVLKDLKRRGKL